jgi:hypothetical protein
MQIIANSDKSNKFKNAVEFLVSRSLLGFKRKCNHMEKFILLFRGSDIYLPDQSPEAYEKLAAKMFSWLADLSERGMHLSSEQFSRSGKQISGSGKLTSDKPFGSHSEIIGGYTILQATDIDQALQAAMLCPILETNGNIEVRPIQGVQI